MPECLRRLLSDLDSKKTCQAHNKPVEFWCSHSACLARESHLVCLQCLNVHMNHTHLMLSEKGLLEILP